MSVRKPGSRRGIAFLMLVFMLLVIVMGSVKLMIGQQISDQRLSRQQQRVEVLNSAIDFVSGIGFQPVEEQSQAESLSHFVLPISDEPLQQVSVMRDAQAESWVATWLKEDVEIESITRKDKK